MTQEMTLQDALRKYVELMVWIREMSAPSIANIDSADDYRVKMQQNFTRIGELSKINNAILDEYYYPLLRSDMPLSDSKREVLREFGEALVNAYNLENLDLTIAYLQAGRLLEDARCRSGQRDASDVLELISAQDTFIMAAYGQMYMTKRLMPCNDIWRTYRKEGIDAGEDVLQYLAPERFATLADEEARKTVLVNARYMRALFERDDCLGDQEINAHDFGFALRAVGLAEDPFYAEHVTDYDWAYHTLRALEYCANLTELNNERGFTTEQIDEITSLTEKLLQQYHGDEAKYSQASSLNNIMLCVLRNRFLSGRMDEAAYKEALRNLFDRQDKSDTMQPEFSLLLIPLEYTLLLDREHTSIREEETLDHFYNEVIRFMHSVARRSTLSSQMNYMCGILKEFIEVPGGMSFEQMGLRLMAALHPPTYVHSLSVASFALCLTEHLLAAQPELFIGMPDIASVEDVKAREEEIKDYVYHAALCHDFGKLMIVETILTYGRNLLPSEFDLIRSHPEIGAFLLKRQASTAAYADIAVGHHKWFNNAGGYPESFDMEKTPYKTPLAIIACADCLDAATDGVGRSYKAGKTLDHYIAEVQAGSGTRYAPYMAGLLTDTRVREDMDELLARGRDENYRKAYQLLKRQDG